MRYLHFYFAFLFALVLGVHSCSAQFLSFNWAYGGPATEYVTDLIHASNGGYLMVGSTGALGSNASDLNPNGYILKTSDTGVPEWDLAIGGTGSDGYHSAAVTANGDYLVVGTRNSGSGNSDIVVTRISQTGVVLWTMRYGTTDRSEGGGTIRALGDDEFVIVGYRLINGGGQDGNILALKIDGEGSVIWTSECGADGQLDAADVIITAGGSILITGVQFVLPNVYMTLVQLDSTGVFQWGNVYVQSVGDTGGSALAPSADGGYLIAGSGGNSDIIINKVDSIGGLVWRKGYDIGAYSSARGILASGDGGFFVTANVEFPGFQQQVFGAFLLDADGGLVDYILQGPEIGFAFPTGSVQNTDGSYTMAGNIASPDRPDDFELIRLPTESADWGALCSTFTDTVNEVALPTISIIHPFETLPPPSFAGVSIVWPHVSGGTSLLLCSNVGVEEDVPIENAVRIFPNPTDAWLTIAVAEHEHNNSVTILNSLGQVMDHFTMRSEISIDLGVFAPGLYMCQVVFGSGQRTTQAFQVR